MGTDSIKTTRSAVLREVCPVPLKMTAKSASDMRTICVILLTLAASVLSTTEWTWKQEPALSDVLPIDGADTSAVKTNNEVGCARLCQADNGCNGFFHDDVSGICLRQRQVYVSSTNMTLAPGWRYYRQVSGCPPERAYVGDRASSTCYRLDGAVTRDWDGARAACADHGAALAVLDTPLKAAFVQEFLDRNDGLGLDHIYIGAQRAGNSSTPFPPSGPDFVWINGTPVNMTSSATFWNTGKPEALEGKGVLRLRPDPSGAGFGWAESFGIYGMHFLCERPFST